MVNRFVPIVLGICWSISARSQSSNQNYVLSRTFQTRQTTGDNGTKFTGEPRDVVSQVMYYDGLGKPIQQVNAYQGGQLQDIAIKTEYDALNRPYRTYLPVPLPENHGNLANVTGTYYSDPAKVGMPTSAWYTQSAYEPTPLNR